MEVRVWIKGKDNPFGPNTYSGVTECVIHDSGLWLIIIIGEVREIMYPTRDVEFVEIVGDDNVPG